jgi:hypothetical protein
VTIDFQPTASVPAGSSGALNISTASCALNNGGNCPDGWAVSDTTIGARAALPAASQLRITCLPAQLTLSPAATASVNCTVSGLATLQAPVTFTRLAVTAPAGWVMTSSTGTISGPSLTLTPNATVSKTVSYSFTVNVTPSCTAPMTPQTFSVASTFSYRSVSYTGPAASFTGAMQGGDGLPSVNAHAVDFGTVVWEATGYPTVQRPLGITVYRPAGCATLANSWSIQVASPGMTSTAGASIPPGALVYLGPGSTVPPGMVAVLGSQPLRTTGLTIATGNASVANGSQWVINLEISPPDDTPPGTYTGTIIVDVVSGSP